MTEHKQSGSPAVSLPPSSLSPSAAGEPFPSEGHWVSVHEDLPPEDAPRLCLDNDMDYCVCDICDGDWLGMFMGSIHVTFWWSEPLPPKPTHQTDLRAILADSLAPAHMQGFLHPERGEA